MVKRRVGAYWIAVGDNMLDGVMPAAGCVLATWAVLLLSASRLVALAASELLAG